MSAVLNVFLTASGNDLWSILFALLALAAVMVLSYFSVKWLGKRAGGRVRGKGNLEILDRQYISQDKCLLIVRVGKQTMLLGVAASQITKLADLSESELILPPKPPEVDFSSVIQKAIEKRFGGNASKGGPKQ